MTRKLEAVYKKIMNNKLLSGIKREIYEILYCSGAMTVGEIAVCYKDRYPRTKRTRNEIAKRVSELVRLSAVEKCKDQRTCPTTNRKITVWQLTGGLPVKPATEFSKNKCREFWQDAQDVSGPLATALIQLSYMGVTRQTKQYQALQGFYDKHFS